MIEISIEAPRRLLWPARPCLGCGGTKECVLCPECRGRGAQSGRSPHSRTTLRVRCERCEGAGKVWRCREGGCDG